MVRVLGHQPLMHPGNPFDVIEPGDSLGLESGLQEEHLLVVGEALQVSAQVSQRQADLAILDQLLDLLGCLAAKPAIPGQLKGDCPGPEGQDEDQHDDERPPVEAANYPGFWIRHVVDRGGGIQLRSDPRQAEAPQETHP